MKVRFCLGMLLGLAFGCGSNTPTGSGGTAGTLATAGTTGAGTAGTTGGTIGTGTNTDPNCPATAPADNDPCAVPSTACTYPTAQCTCEAVNLVGSWSCNEIAGGAGNTAGTGGQQQNMICPDAVPQNGTACTPGRGTCMFTANECDCPRDTELWVCWDPMDCPQTPPAEQSACPLVGMRCEYQGGGGQQGGGGGGRCDCENNGWDCGGDFTGGNDAGL